MLSRHLRKRMSATLLALAAVAAGCSGKDTTTNTTKIIPETRVNIAGEYVIITNTTAQLAATTIDGVDTSYTWASSNEAVATVSAAGLVKGLTAGKATISATGDQTGAKGSYQIVVSSSVPYLADWSASGHNAYADAAFRDWDDTGAVPASCSRCHSSTGYQNYVSGLPAVNVPVGETIDCNACHSSAAQALSSVKFPSGMTISGLGAEARCMTCHQGRESTISVNKAIDAIAGAFADPDLMSTKLGFKNVHYFAAGATLEGNRAMGAMQYPGKKYDARFRHVPGYDTCIDCHDQHTLAVKETECVGCHGATGLSPRDIRAKSSEGIDYDGDGNTTEGLDGEIATLRDRLMTAMRQYTVAKSLDAICYSPTTYPYFLIDANNNGVCDATETTKYAKWTGRLLRAAYNMQYSVKDPGAFAHNGKYVIEILYDAIADMNAGGAAVSMAAMHRTDEGHFDGSGEPARHWDPAESVTSLQGTGAETVPASCSKCHSGSAGYRFYVSFGATQAVEPGNGLDCATCHAGFYPTASDKKLVTVASATFPSTLAVKADADSVLTNKALHASSMICVTCHMGVESKKSVDAMIPVGADPDVVDTANLSFKNVHYFAAGSVLLGTEAKVAYEYDGKTYAGRRNHTSNAGRGIDCTGCHAGPSHTFSVQERIDAGDCVGCHNVDPVAPADIRMTSTDFNGNGDTTESVSSELDTIATAVLNQMQTVAVATAGANLCYDCATYPYWFKHTATGTNGAVCDTGEASYANQFKKWTPRLAKAAFNYQFYHKDPGAWAHNPNYSAQILIDTAADLGASVTGYNRP